MSNHYQKKWSWLNYRKPKKCHPTKLSSSRVHYKIKKSTGRAFVHLFQSRDVLLRLLLQRPSVTLNQGNLWINRIFSFPMTGLRDITLYLSLTQIREINPPVIPPVNKKR